MKITIHRLAAIAFVCLGMQFMSASHAAIPASFLNLGNSARATGLGGAFVALADDVTAVHWNPAGLTQLERPAISFLNRVTTVDTDYLTLTGAWPLPNVGTVALGLNYYGVSDVNMYDAKGLATGVLNDKEAVVSLAYAFQISDLSLGTSAQYYYQRIAGDVAATNTGGYALSAAALYRLSNQFRVGVKAIGNNDLEDLDNADSYQVEMPLTITTGINWSSPWDSPVRANVGVDVTQRQEYPLFANVGTEILLWNTLALRGGVRDIPLERRGADIGYESLWRAMVKPVVGVGFYRGSEYKQRFSLDYALSIEQLGLRSFISLGYEF